MHWLHRSCGHSVPNEHKNFSTICHDLLGYSYPIIAIKSPPANIPMLASE